MRALALPRRGQRIDALTGKRIELVEARGKNLLITFEGGTVLHTHLQMNGAWRGYGPGERVPAITGDVVVAIEVDGAVALCFRAPTVRLLRASALVADETIGALGPDPIRDDFDADAALARLRERDAEPLGVAILDQRAIAGIGNVWKSELLFEQRLDPFAPVARFADDELRKLLARAVAHMRHGMRPSRVYRRAGRACSRCRGAIAMERQGPLHRSTYFCPRCQPARAEASP